MGGERRGENGSAFTSKKSLENKAIFPQHPASTKSDMCLYAACLNADWEGAVSEDHIAWIQTTYDNSEED